MNKREKIKQYVGDDIDHTYVILHHLAGGTHSILHSMSGWFDGHGNSGITPNWSGNKPYSPNKCFLFSTIDDAQTVLKLVIKNLIHIEHKKSIEILKWKDVKSYDIM